jgi:hypothetical protein
LFAQHWALITLLLFVIVTRIPYLIDGVIPFGFDHGKDSLAIFHMLVTKSPKFIGPWTSIPGLYFGPAWYYLLAPAYLIGRFNPVSAVYVMLLLVLIQVVLAYKYSGKTAAIITASAPLWMIISTSAWNPFPMTLITFLILIIFQKIKQNLDISKWQALGLGLLASLGFHFSAAYAIFYPLAIGVGLLSLKPKFELKQIVWAGIGFTIPFIPQLLFELKHDFVQTQAVINYFSQGEPHIFSWTKIRNVVETTLSELTLAFVPEQRGLSQTVTQVVKFLFLTSLLGLGIKQFFQKKNNINFKYYASLVFGFIVIPIIGFFFLHFNFWYVYAMMPIAAVIVAKIIDTAPRWYKFIVYLLLLLTPIFSYVQYVRVDRENLVGARAMLPVKKNALRTIRDRAKDKNFASYHYVPDIYDFSYQYLYFVEAAHGKILPVEFSYEPRVEPYVVQKQDLLEKYPQQKGDPEIIFYVVEKPNNEDFLQNWWSRQKYSEIIEEIKLSKEVKLYVAKP